MDKFDRHMTLLIGSGYTQACQDVHSILIEMMVQGLLSRDQVESITVEMEKIEAIRKETDYAITKPE